MTPVEAIIVYTTCAVFVLGLLATAANLMYKAWKELDD